MIVAEAGARHPVGQTPAARSRFSKVGDGATTVPYAFRCESHPCNLPWGRDDNERYPLPSSARPGYVFAWDGHDAKAYQIVPEILRTNRGPAWVATPLMP